MNGELTCITTEDGDSHATLYSKVGINDSRGHLPMPDIHLSEDGVNIGNTGVGPLPKGNISYETGLQMTVNLRQGAKKRPNTSHPQFYRRRSVSARASEAWIERARRGFVVSSLSTIGLQGR